MKTRVPPTDTIPAPSPWISKSLNTLPSPPGPTERFPFEQLWKLQKMSILPYVRSLVRAHGDLVRTNFAQIWVYVACHPDDVREILQAKHRHFVKGAAADLIRDALGYSILGAEGALHRRQQKLMQPSFRGEAIERYASMMLECFQNADQSWQDGAYLQLVAEMHRVTMNVATRTLFNMPPGEKQEQLGQALTTLMHGIVERIMTPFGILKATFPQIPDKPWRDCLKLLDDEIDEIIRQHELGNLPDDDLLGQLMAATDDSGQRLSREQLRDETLTLFVGGHETTAIALSWAFYEIARDRTLQKQLQEEVGRVCGGRHPSYADLPQPSFCRKVFQETMRHYPPFPTILRQVLEDVELRGYRVPRGSLVAMSPYIIHHDPRFYSNPDKFDPSRWTETFTEQLHKFAYLPFSRGPRVCIGERFAWCEGILALAYFTQRWDFDLAPFQDVKPGSMMTLRPEGEIEIIVRRRNENDAAASPNARNVPGSTTSGQCPVPH